MCDCFVLCVFGFVVFSSAFCLFRCLCSESDCFLHVVSSCRVVACIRCECDVACFACVWSCCEFLVFLLLVSLLVLFNTIVFLFLMCCC